MDLFSISMFCLYVDVFPGCAHTNSPVQQTNQNTDLINVDVKPRKQQDFTFETLGKKEEKKKQLCQILSNILLIS